MVPLPAYTVTEVLSRGGRVAVQRAVRVTDGRRVVLKVLDPHHSRPRDLARLKHELELAKPFANGAVVEPLGLATHEGMPALVLDDFGGASLDSLLGRPMPIERFLPLAIGITVAVAAIHARGVVHKDLKPQNILVHPLTGEIKLTDLGIASRLPREPAPAPGPGRIEGSLPYLSPEQTGRMNRGVDTRSDLYALGVTFYQMLTGRLPFEARDPPEWVHCHVARAPRAPSEIEPGIPEVLSAIVLKLLAKMAEDRYQTARGLQRDLERCLAGLRSEGIVASFPLGRDDVSDRFEIAQKLHGREAELAVLRRAFDETAFEGKTQLVLVSGDPGVGKSSLIGELHRPIVEQRGFFVSGKFEQYKRDIPYATFAGAFAQLAEQILTESEERVLAWRDALLRALGVNAQLIVDIVPQVGRILGPQPPIVQLPPLEAQNRFHIVFRQFVGVFAAKEHPLALFLDDLQWLDSGSLRLLEELITSPESHHLLVLGAYRDNEVGPSHPLRLAVSHVQKAGGVVHELALAPLCAADIGRIIAAALHGSEEHAAPLARLVHEKTGGNPFFAIQFLTTLHEEGLLQLDAAAGEWRWDAAGIDAKGFTDNVVDLMVRKIERLSEATREVLKLAACAGSSTPLRTLSLISGRSVEQIERDLWPAAREGLIFCRDDTCTFLHDRVQQGAYALIEDGDKQAIHLRIGRLLLSGLSPAAVEERIFDVVSQLDKGRGLLTDQAEMDEIARLNILAGRKAKASIAYASARRFFAVAAELLPARSWECCYDLTFPLFLERAECEYLSGDLESAERLFEILVARAATRFDKALVYERRLKLYHVAGKYDEGLAMALEALSLFGVTLPEDDEALAEATRVEASAVARSLSGRTIADIADAPEATDPEVRAVIGLLSNAAPAAYIGTRPQVFPLLILKLVRWSLERGHTRESCMGYSGYGFLLVSLYDDPHRAREISEMSIRLNEKLGDAGGRGRGLHLHGDHINFWTRPLATDFPILEKGFSACLDTGDLVFASYIAFEIVWQAIERGDTLDDVLALSVGYAAFARDSRNDAVYRTIRIEQQFLACLQGRTRHPGTFDDATFEEGPCLAAITSATFMCGVVFFHMMKLVVAYLFDDTGAALHHAEEAKKTLLAAMAMPMEATFHFFDALVLARAHGEADLAARPDLSRRLEEHERKLAFWAKNCPENFRAKHALVSAEMARLKGDALLAEERYGEAIRSARESGFVHWEALANEVAGRFYLDRGMETAALAHLREARHGYARWGADAKVRQLEQRHPSVLEVLAASPSATIVAAAEQLDLLSVAKASQTISREIVQDQLVRTLLQVVLEQGGAQRVCLLLCREGKITIEAEAALDEGGAVDTVLDSVPLGSSPRVPRSLIHYVQRTKERVILGDAAASAGKFSGDDYFARARARSVLCMPVPRQADVVGLLYLENKLLAFAFTPERLVALELLATQAAISLQNAQLLAEERAARVAAEAAEHRAAFLAEAGALMTESLDYEDTFRRLGRLSVRAIATWCMIDVVEGREVLRVASAHADPTKEPLLVEFRSRYPPTHDSPHPAAEVLRTGRPLLMPEITDDEVRARTLNDDHVAALRELGLGSLIVVPLVSRGETLGTLSLVSAPPRRRYGPADLALATEVARRAASAIDNARLYRASQEAVRARNEFLTVASHELNTPVTSLMLALHSLRRATSGLRPPVGPCAAAPGRVPDPQTLDKLIGLAARQGDRLTKLVADLLDISRIEAGRLQLALAPFDLRALAFEVAERLEPDAARACCPVSVTSGAPVVGTWDRSRIDRVVTNLVSNAIKFGAGKPIELSVGGDAGRARLVVRDEGIGIAPRERARIFGRFERAVSERHYGGLGLGLYICRRIVEEHGGTIQCESEPGKGSVFEVELPLS